MMDFRHLRSFVVAAEEENLHRAAERLNIVQSALSVQIRDLEQQLGTKLFERLGRRVHLSEIGRIYLNDARAILAEIERANDRVMRAAKGHVGPLKISLNRFAVNRTQVLRSISTFCSRHPEIDLQLSQMDSMKQIDALRARKIDAGYVYNLSDRHTEFDRCEVGKMDWVLAMPKDHRLAKRKHLVLSELSGETFVWLQRSSNLRLYDFLLGECVSHGLTPRIGQQVMSWEMSLDVVAAGMGIAFVVEALGRGYQDDLVFKKVEDLQISLPFHLIWRRDNESATLKRFVEVARPFYGGPTAAAIPARKTARKTRK